MTIHRSCHKFCKRVIFLGLILNKSKFFVLMTNWLAATASNDGVQGSIVLSGIANIIIKVYYPVSERVCLKPH